MDQTKNDRGFNDYQEFLNSGDEQIPLELKNKVFFKIQKMLNPSIFIVLLKVLGLHSIFGFLSLSICHQFGLNPFNTESSISDWMMNMAGHRACMFGCGLLFISLSLFAAGYFLSIEEMKVLKRTQFLQTFVLGIFSLSLFTLFGVEFVLEFASLWLIGSLIGGVATTQVVWRLRKA